MYVYQHLPLHPEPTCKTRTLPQGPHEGQSPPHACGACPELILDSISSLLGPPGCENERFSTCM